MDAANEGAVLDEVALERIRRVGGEKLLGQMMDLCLERFPRLAAEVHQGLEAGNREASARAAHAMKSSAGNLGAVDLAAICGRIETLDSSPGEGARILSAELARALEAAVVSFRNLRAKAAGNS